MSSEREVMEERERQREFQAEQTEKQASLRAAFDGDSEPSDDWIDELLSDDELEERLPDMTVKKIEGVLNNHQWTLANLTDAETHDRWYWLEVLRIKILGEHPPQGSVVEGPLRAYLFDDSMEQLPALTAQERNTIDQLIKGLQNEVTRSREGFEREQINTNIARTESETKTESEESGGLTGLF